VTFPRFPDNAQLADCLINSSALPANPENMEFYFLLICIVFIQLI